MRKLQTTIWIACVALFLSGATAWAQTVTGSVRGTVTDPSGAVVAGANVIVTNIATGVETKTTTNQSGLYNVQFLILGNYTVDATAPGFKTATAGPFTLQIDQIAQINLKLQVGAASTTVNVSGSTTPILNTVNASLGTSLSANALKNMPLPGLNVLYATLFVPGSVNPTSASMGGLQGSYRNTSEDGVPSFNGNRQQANNFVLDGIEINETMANLSGYNPSPYSLQEMRVITGNASAEFGNVNGGEVLMVTKSGTNHFHGDAFEYFQNQNFAANSWGNNYSDLPKTKFSQHQFGADIGGPIVRNRLFFFFDYAGMRRTLPPSLVATSVPDAAERLGDFSEVAAVEGNPIYDTSNGTNTATIYPGNTLPAIVNPVAVYLFAHPELLPLPNATPDPDTVTGNNYHVDSSTKYINNQYDGRVDYTMSRHDTLMVKGTYGRAHDFQTKVALPVIFPLADNYPFYMGVIDWVHTFSPSLVNEFRAGYSRIVEATTTSDPTGVFGKNGDSILGIGFPTAQPLDGFTQMQFIQTDNSSYGTDISAGTSTIDNNYIYGDNLTWVHGNHIVKFGAQFVRYQENYVAPSNLGGMNGMFSYTGAYTSAQSSAGDGYADFELDKSQTALRSGVAGAFGARQWRSAYYVQDDWKMRPNLTVNLGLRYSYFQPMYEAHDKMVSIDLVKARFAPVSPTGPDPTPYLLFAGKNGNSRALMNPYRLGFLPRVGFAWQFDPRIVLRGGYGITDAWEGTGSGLRMTQNAPFLTSNTNIALSPSPTSGGTPLSVADGFTGGTTATTSAQYDIWDPNFRPAQIQQFNLTMQMQLASRTSVQFGYVGQIGRHIAVPIILNQYIAPVPATCDPSDTTGCVDLVAPYYAVVGGNSQIVETASQAYSNYHGLQTTLHQQESNGLEFTLNYTWSHAMNNNPGGYFNVDGVAGGYYAFWQDAYNPRGDYGNANFDVRNSFSGTVVYQLPFGHQERFGANWNRITDEVAGGWKLAANASLQSGFPITIGILANDNLNSAADNSNYNYLARANFYFPMKIVNRSPASWFGTDPSATPCKVPGARINALGAPCSYGAPAFNEFGTAQNGSERAPGFRNIDLSLFKAFRTVGNQSFKLRIDAYNAFNLVSLAGPLPRVGSGIYGRIRSSLSAPRQLQISGVYTF